MRENEQQVDKKAELKKAYIGNAVMLLVLTIGIILAVLAWYNRMFDTATASGMQYESVDDKDIEFHTYQGTLQSDGETVIYASGDLNNENFVESDDYIIPGEKRYFKTVITNNEADTFIGTLILQNILVNKEALELAGGKKLITFAAEGDDPENEGERLPQQTSDIASAVNYSDEGGVNEAFQIVYTQPIYENITLPGNDSYTVYWYFVLNSTALNNQYTLVRDAEDNLVGSGYEIMGDTLLKFNAVRFLIDHTVE